VVTEYGFSYRGNGYGFWPTQDAAIAASQEKRLADSSNFVVRFGRPSAMLWLCKDKKPAKLLRLIT